jgi:medium-chain acyl-[acyl-carrier-protein] hydrolase
MAFRNWQKSVPSDVLVLAASLPGISSIYLPVFHSIIYELYISFTFPGRMRRAGEAPFKSMAPLVSQLCDALAATNITSGERPWAILGHSMGSCVAFEVCLELQRRGLAANALPRLLFASGSRAPSWRMAEHPNAIMRVAQEKTPSYSLSDDDFLLHLASLGGTPQEVLENRELMEYCLPFLRADFEVIDTYRPSVPLSINTPVSSSSSDSSLQPQHLPPPLDIPVVALGGSSDEGCPQAALQDWLLVTSSPSSSTHTFEGGHFFIDQADVNGVFQVLNEQLQRI